MTSSSDSRKHRNEKENLSLDRYENVQEKWWVLYLHCWMFLTKKYTSVLKI